MKCIKTDLANFNKVNISIDIQQRHTPWNNIHYFPKRFNRCIIPFQINKDFLSAVKDKMSTYDQRMEESEKKLHERLEDFEAERRDAELAFKVFVRSHHFYQENHPRKKIRL